MNDKRSPRTFRAPGRVNLIGEHTDYNDGFVMPAPINLYTQVSIKNRSDRRMLIHSDSFSEDVEFDLDDPAPQEVNHWSNYILGVAIVLEQAGYRLKGAELTIQSDVPIGAGLGSSAAIEVAAAYALLGELHLDRLEIAMLCQRAENEIVGTRCGIMDQFVSCLGRAGSVMLLDCRSLEYHLLPLPEEARLVICNTMVKHELCSSEYNARRAECESGASQIAKSSTGVKTLRDVTLNDLEQAREHLEDNVFKRCRHVITENDRVVEAATALECNDLAGFGRLMGESHRSLRDDFDASCDELDAMVDLAMQFEGVYGARMTGAGFGGCTINLVEADCVAEFKRKIAEGYSGTTGITPAIYVCSTADGVREITV